MRSPILKSILPDSTKLNSCPSWLGRSAQSNWNGVIGRIALEAKARAYVSTVRIVPDVKGKKVLAEVRIQNANKRTLKGTLKVEVRQSAGTSSLPEVIQECDLKKGENSIQVVYPMGDNPHLWDEFNPYLYTMNVQLETKAGIDEWAEMFGMRELSVKGTQITINDRPVFFRGTLECCIFPETGYPSMDEAYWERIMRTCRAYGLNHLRFHSWCPPEAAFNVADRLGFYFYVECGAWARVGDGAPIDRFVKNESERIVQEYANHPSFCLFSYGNEPSGDHHQEYLTDFVNHWKAKDRRFLCTTAAGWPSIEENDWHCTPVPRIQGWGEGVKSIINSTIPSSQYDWESRISKTCPTISHEIGQWCVYPDFKEIDKYTGVLKAKNFEIFKETLREKGLEDMAEEFLYASGRLQTLCYKADIEAALRTPGFAGFQLLDLHDFPGQGTALVGVLNAFWESKGYVDDKEYSQFCGQTVPLARMSKLIWKNDERFKAEIEFAHFGEKPMKESNIIWSVETKDGKVVQSGSFRKDIPLGNLIEIGNVEFPLEVFSDPVQLNLKVGIENTAIENNWNIWVYPSEEKKVENMPYITHEWNQTAIDRLNKGESVLLLAYGKIAPKKGGDIKVAFSPIFWNTAWTHNVPPHTLGFLCDPSHPAFSLFPNDGYSDYQWKDLAVNCNAVVMDDFPQDFRPLVYVIDDWFKNRKLGVLFEGKVGKGKLMVCSVDLDTNMDKRLSAVQFKRSLLEYMASQEFDPAKEIPVDLIEGLFVK